jgi:hypothetical protein
MARKMEFLETNAIGLDGIFNTPRLGLKWFEEVNSRTPLDLVVVDEKGNRQKFGTATVVGKVFGKSADLAPLHALYFHGCALRDLTGKEVLDEYEAAMRRAYGERFKPDEGVTFVYMIRTDDNEAGRDEAPQIVGNDPAAAKDY